MDAVVVDASLIYQALISPEYAVTVEATLGRATLVAPDVLNLEIMTTLRRDERTGKITSDEADTCVDRLRHAPIRRIATDLLIDATWMLRGNLTSYDASYIALAAQLRLPVATRDGKIARAPGVNVPILVI